MKESYYTVYSDDGEEPQLLIDGDKQDVFETLDQYDPKGLLVTEWSDDSIQADKIESLNGEEWLMQNSCPVCHRMDFNAVLDESLTSQMMREILKTRIKNSEAKP